MRRHPPRGLLTWLAVLALGLAAGPAFADPPRDKPAARAEKRSKRKPAKKRRATAAKPAAAKPAAAKPAAVRPPAGGKGRSAAAKATTAPKRAAVRQASSTRPATRAGSPKHPVRATAAAVQRDAIAPPLRGLTPLEPPPAPLPPVEHPDRLAPPQVVERLRFDPASLGSLSVGRPSAGALFNGQRMPEGPHWRLVDPTHAWGTAETVDAVARCITRVNEQFPRSQKLRIGHISARHGGPLTPHVSHQAGRDVDVSYYYLNDDFQWYRRATEDTLDRARTWAFVRALITETDVQLILINTSVQKLLKEHAASIGEDTEWLDGIFQYGHSGRERPVIIHVAGHDTHIHIRFFNPVAQEVGRLAFSPLVERKLITPRVYHVSYLAQRGDTLGALAARFDTTVEAILEANDLKAPTIFAGKAYRIPQQGQVAAPTALALPPRRLPPAPPELASSTTGQAAGAPAE